MADIPHLSANTTNSDLLDENDVSTMLKLDTSVEFCYSFISNSISFIIPEQVCPLPKAKPLSLKNEIQKKEKC